MFKNDIILKIAKNYLEDFFIYQIDEKAHVLIFFKGFKPYLNFKKTACAVSSFYVCSNEVYFLSKTICEKLNESGIQAEIYKEHNLKKIAFENSGLVKGQNTLLYHEKYGSYFAIGAIKIFSNLITNEKRLGTNCNNCGKCSNACPVSALKDGELLRDRCLRQKMNGIINDDFSARLMENNILGCEICQRCCPLNNKIEKIAPKKELEDILDISDLIANAEKGNKHLENLGDYIGKNYAKRIRILSMAINSAGNSKDKKYLRDVGKFTKSLDEAVRVNALRAVRLLTDAD